MTNSAFAYYIGIDPGKGGGIAVLNPIGTIYHARKMPETERELLDYLGAFHGGKAMLERVRASPQMGVVSAFTFGWGYGMLRMALVASGIAFDEVTPQRWQAYMGALSGGDKNVTKRRAEGLWPAGAPDRRRITHAIADALLIAEYLRRNELSYTVAPRKRAIS